MNIYAIEVVSGDDVGTALGVFVNGTVNGVIAALDASARTTGFDQLDVVLVVQANAMLGVALSAVTSAGVVLAPCVGRVQSINFFGTDAPGDCESNAGIISHREWMVAERTSRVTHVGRNVLHRPQSRF